MIINIKLLDFNYLLISLTGEILCVDKFYYHVDLLFSDIILFIIIL